MPRRIKTPLTVAERARAYRARKKARDLLNAWEQPAEPLTGDPQTARQAEVRVVGYLDAMVRTAALNGWELGEHLKRRTPDETAVAVAEWISKQARADQERRRQLEERSRLLEATLATQTELTEHLQAYNAHLRAGLAAVSKQLAALAGLLKAEFPPGDEG